MSASWILTSLLYAAAFVAAVAVASRWKSRRGIAGAIVIGLAVAAIHAYRTRQTFLLREWLWIAGFVALSEVLQFGRRAKIITAGALLVIAGLSFFGEFREYQRQTAVRASRCPLVGLMIWVTSDERGRVPANRDERGSSGVLVQTYSANEWVHTLLSVQQHAEHSGKVAEAAENARELVWENLPAATRTARGLLVLTHRHVAATFADNAGFGFRRMTPRMMWPDVFLPEMCQAPELAGTAAIESLEPAETILRASAVVAGGATEAAVVRIPDGSRRWTASRVQLVGLLQHWIPVVYDIPQLPTMQETEEVPTRPLDGFESRALARLEQGEEVVLEASADRIRMMGSLRATHSSCTRCHRVSDRTLLGAITYVLEPAATAASTSE